jgi:hypothetical protein
MNRIAKWIIDRAKRTPYSHIPGYMERYWLVPYEAKGTATIPKGCVRLSWRRNPIGRLLQKCNIAIRVHYILREDRDLMMHDHPWPFISCVLDGWYLESRPMYGDQRFEWNEATKREWYRLSFRGTWSWAFRRATDRHRIVDLPLEGCYSLFITLGPPRHPWGFYDQHQKMYWWNNLGNQ